MSIRVVVVDGQALMRGGLAMVLGHQDDIEVVAEAGTGVEAISAAPDPSAGRDPHGHPHVDHGRPGGHLHGSSKRRTGASGYSS